MTEVAICAGEISGIGGFRTEIHRSTTDEVGVGDRPRWSEVVGRFAGPPRYGVVRVELESAQIRTAQRCTVVTSIERVTRNRRSLRSNLLPLFNVLRLVRVESEQRELKVTFALPLPLSCKSTVGSFVERGRSNLGGSYRLAKRHTKRMVLSRPPHSGVGFVST